MSFADLKKQSKLGSLTSKLVKEVEKMNTPSGGDDHVERWTSLAMVTALCVSSLHPMVKISHG